MATQRPFVGQPDLLAGGDGPLLEPPAVGPEVLQAPRLTTLTGAGQAR